MNVELFKRLKALTPEERTIANGQNAVEWAIYTDDNEKKHVVDHEKLLEEGKLITARKHTRFVQFPPHKHNYVEFFYVYSGTVRHVIGDEEIAVRSGELLFMNQYVEHGIYPCGENDIAVNLIIMPEFFELLQDMVGRDNLLGEFVINVLQQKESKAQYLYFPVSNNMCVQNLMDNIIYSIYYKQNNEDNILAIAMGLIFLHLLSNAEQGHVTIDEKEANMLIMTVRQYIADEFQNGTLKELGCRTGYSVPALSRLIKRYTGTTFKEMQAKYRMETAMKLLSETDQPISEIAITVGYENQSFFYKRFRREIGLTPNEFRKQARRE
ncbi:MAG: AraC family transcriptional regulator [Clostridiales bacterium]|nr:AraC family transcriptional regulator [Clostridiales bacterium]